MAEDLRKEFAHINTDDTDLTDFHGSVRIRVIRAICVLFHNFLLNDYRCIRILQSIYVVTASTSTLYEIHSIQIVIARKTTVNPPFAKAIRSPASFP